MASRMGCSDGVSAGAGKTRPTRHRVCCAARRSVVLSRARRASSRPDSSKHCAQRTQTLRARVLRSQAQYLDQGQEGASALSGAPDP